MKATPFEAQGIKTAFYLDMDAMADIEENVGMLGHLLEALGDKNKGRIRAMCATAAFLSAGAARLDSTVEAVPAETFRKLRPAVICDLYNAIITAINDGFRMETSQPDPEADVDVTLQEIEKKDQRGG